MNNKIISKIVQDENGNVYERNWKYDLWNGQGVMILKLEI